MTKTKEALKNMVKAFQKQQVVKPEGMKRLERVTEAAEKAGREVRAEKEK